MYTLQVPSGSPSVAAIHRVIHLMVLIVLDYSKRAMDRVCGDTRRQVYVYIWNLISETTPSDNIDIG